MKLISLLTVLLCVIQVSNGQKIENYNFIGSRTYRYNHQGEKIEKHKFSKDKLVSKTLYKYDKNGQHVNSLVYEKFIYCR